MPIPASRSTSEGPCCSRSTATSTGASRASARASPSARTTTSTISSGADAAGTVPVQLAARLRRSHLLFLGYARRRLEPARLPAPRLGRRPPRLPLVGGAARAEPVARRALAASAGSRCTTSRSTTYAEELARLTAALERRTRRERCPPSPFKGLAYFGDSELDGLLLLRPRARDGARRREPDGVPADRALRAERRRQELAAACGRRAAAARARPGGWTRGGSAPRS